MPKCQRCKKEFEPYKVKCGFRMLESAICKECRRELEGAEAGK